METHMKLNVFIEPVFRFLQTIPKGRVVTYKTVAQQCGLLNPRNVSWILRQNTEPDRIPCYKVVRRNGHLATGYKFGGPKEQWRRLVADGVVFKGSVVSKEY